jgi:hypothetical protein
VNNAGEGQDQHRDDQGEDRQPIDAAADPAVKSEKDLLQFHRILARGVLSGCFDGSVRRQIGSKPSSFRQRTADRVRNCSPPKQTIGRRN